MGAPDHFTREFLFTFPTNCKGIPDQTNTKNDKESLGSCSNAFLMNPLPTQHKIGAWSSWSLILQSVEEFVNKPIQHLQGAPGHFFL